MMNEFIFDRGMDCLVFFMNLLREVLPLPSQQKSNCLMAIFKTGFKEYLVFYICKKER